MSRVLLIVREHAGRILGLGLISALVLGTVGYLEFGVSFLDSLYGALALFVFAYTDPPSLAANGPPQEPNLALQVARFLAPLTTVTAGITAVLIVLSQASDRFLARRLRNHTIICNPANGGLDLATNLKAGGGNVVVVIDQPDQGLVGDLRLEGIPVVEGNPAIVGVLSAAGAPYAKRIVALPADERVNFGIAAALSSIATRIRRQEVFLFSDDLDTVDYLTARTLPRTLERLTQKDAQSSARSHATESIRVVEWNSIERIASLTLIGEFLPLSNFDPADLPELLVIGRSPLSDAFIIELAKVWWISQERVPRISGAPQPDEPEGDLRQPLPLRLIDPDAAAWREDLVSRYPEIEKALLFREGKASVHDLGESAKASGLSESQHVAFIVGEDPTLIIRSLAQLESLLSLPVRVVVGTDAQGIEAMAELGFGPGAEGSRPRFEVSGFDLYRRLYTKEMLSNSLVEQLANLNHLVYLEDDHIIGRPADQPWEDLDDADRESNRRAAIHHLGYKLNALGLTILPLSSRFSSEAPSELTEAEIEEMAIAEHDRWMEEKLAGGWTPNPALEEQDRVKKEHPDLVPWEHLSPETKDQDRIFVRALPRMLKSCGFRVVRQ